MVNYETAGRFDFKVRPLWQRMVSILTWLTNECAQVRSSYIQAKAEQGNPRAQYKLGTMYEAGTGVRQDQTKALKWYRSAAYKGIPAAQYCLGMRYAEGHGVPKDDTEARIWFLKAAEQGHREGQYELANLYFEGKGGPTDLSQARKWFRKAADTGHQKAKLIFEELIPASR